MFNSTDKVLKVSEPKVMQSAAGFYVGSECLTELTYANGDKQIITEPYNRYTGYYATKKEATELLEMDFDEFQKTKEFLGE